MVYDHIVKINGIVYPAGADVPGRERTAPRPEPEKQPAQTERKPVERPKKKED